MEQNASVIAVVTAAIERFKRNDWGEVDATGQTTNNANAAIVGEVIACYTFPGRDDPIRIVAWPGHRYAEVIFRSDYKSVTKPAVDMERFVRSRRNEVTPMGCVLASVTYSMASTEGESTPARSTRSIIEDVLRA